MYIAKPRTAKSWQNMTNNARGHMFENYIKGACAFYRDNGVAVIEQTPEPFRTTSTNRDGSFTGRFIANAQPDFKGTLQGGRAICFEAKYTSTNKMAKGVVTLEQEKTLEAHYSMGAIAGVCICIKDIFAFIPWAIWREMKGIYGRQYLTAADVEDYRIEFNGHALFLNFINKQEVEKWILPEKTMMI